MATNIEWTDVTDNIIAVKGGGWWCRKISPGCANCYAEKLNKNAFYNGNMAAYTGAPPELILRTELMDSWKRQRVSKRHFVGSMTDIFGDWISQDWTDQFLTAMILAPKQVFQLLTKRPGIANERICDFLNRHRIERLPANIWVGTSVEDQIRADERIPELLAIPAKVRFLSCEPLLGPVDLNLGKGVIVSATEGKGIMSTVGRMIHWVIAGGESGSKARPMHPDWARSLRDQCQAAGVPFLFKQWGEHLPICMDPPETNRTPDGQDWHKGKPSVVVQLDGSHRTEFPPGAMTCIRIGKKAAGRLLDGREWNEFPTTEVAP